LKFVPKVIQLQHLIPIVAPNHVILITVSHTPLISRPISCVIILTTQLSSNRPQILNLYSYDLLAKPTQKKTVASMVNYIFPQLNTPKNSISIFPFFVNPTSTTNYYFPFPSGNKSTQPNKSVCQNMKIVTSIIMIRTRFIFTPFRTTLATSLNWVYHFS